MHAKKKLKKKRKVNTAVNNLAMTGEKKILLVEDFDSFAVCLCLFLPVYLSVTVSPHFCLFVCLSLSIFVCLSVLGLSQLQCRTFNSLSMRKL